MCGITGIYHFDVGRTVDGSILLKMTNQLVHRGPDGSGYYIHRNIGLGHRRLAIIDLHSGDQPQFNDDKSIAIVFNGEIYNYIEIKEELKGKGYHFRTNSDTEVIIRAYEHWGVKCQDKFNGMWAFAIWDSKQQQLFISRDRLGEKPLYYAIVDNSVVFASEIKSLIEYGIEPEPNYELTELYLMLGYIPAPYSYYKSIFKLRQGHYLIGKETLKEFKYWDTQIPLVSEMISDRAYVYKQFEELFYDAVKIRMRSDVPYGAFLSGGLDSASVVAAMASISKMPIRTFTIGFEDRQFDERKLALDVANKFNTDHSEFIVQPDNFEESLERILHHYDEPFGDSSAIPTGYVSSIASKKVKMVLTGDGGDEVLSGYNSYQIEKFVGRYRHLPTFVKQVLPKFALPFKRLASGDWQYRINRLERILEYSQMSFESRLIIKSSWYMPVQIERMTHGLGHQIKISDFVSDLYRTFPLSDPFYKLMHFHYQVQLPDDFMVKVDRMSMASSIETRVPFLDHRLVELMVRVSKNIKMEGYERKSVLRKTIGRKLPSSVLKGAKKGFSVPVREWFKDSGFHNRLRLLYEEDFGLDQSIIKKIVNSHKSGEADFGYFIWILFVLKGWNKTLT
ncbi:MAG: asparagine synthase (glutamine-hydrolyzing) [Cyclobacteriaceae bacterium]|nr:asparagine synthase (glutamine-hydrolyzing) [Cyclobacteriaceae bacterium]